MFDRLPITNILDLPNSVDGMELWIKALSIPGDDLVNFQTLLPRHYINVENTEKNTNLIKEFLPSCREKFMYSFDSTTNKHIVGFWDSSIALMFKMKVV
jgi:hypothetical protein